MAQQTVRDPKASTQGETEAPAPPKSPAAPISPLQVPVKGEARMYYVGLIESAPMDVIDVPTVALPIGDGKSVIRGKCVSVPKWTGRLSDDGHGNFNHVEKAQQGRFEKLYDIEVEAFLKYVKTHVFRKTSEYSVPVPGRPGESKSYWRADIEPMDSSYATIRGLHDDETIRQESLANYVWIAKAEMSPDGKPFGMGAMKTVSQEDAEKEGK